MNGGRGRERRGGRGSGGSGPGARGGGGSPLGDDEVARILSGDAAAIVDGARKVAEETRARASQVRNVYSALVQIRQSAGGPKAKLARLILLKPRLEYTAAREKAARPLSGALTRLIDGLQKDPGAIDHVFEFAEALVAYHKALRA